MHLLVIFSASHSTTRIGIKRADVYHPQLNPGGTHEKRWKRANHVGWQRGTSPALGAANKKEGDK